MAGGAGRAGRTSLARQAPGADPTLKPRHLRGKTRFSYPPGTMQVGERSSPYTTDVHHTIAAEVEVPGGGAEVVLTRCGGMTGGWTLLGEGRKPLLGA